MNRVPNDLELNYSFMMGFYSTAQKLAKGNDVIFDSQSLVNLAC